VVIPLVAWLLYRLLQPVEEIRRYVEDIRAHGDGLATELEAAALTTTSEQAARFVNGVRRYADILDRQA
jgi:hypothetical protein